ncbi:MAG TPA: L,D-transpeptidase family protein [Candidatus Binataceae bacterium]|nr:L,D-transpeptidase family protein [Candidatus Binataceae bacterium]
MIAASIAALFLTIAAIPPIARAWDEDAFDTRPVTSFPIPQGRNNIIGNLITYQLQKGDTLLDVGRWFGLTAKELSDANGHMDWWSPPVGKKIVLPAEHILPAGPHVGIILNIPEMRLYYYYPSPLGHYNYKSKLTRASMTSSPHSRRGVTPSLVYTYPVGLGRYDWRTPVASFTVRGKTKDPTWVVPDDIYQEHLERDGEAVHVVKGGDPDNPLGDYRLELTLPMYALHGTDVPWGVGMEVSHGCVRLYPEDIDRLFHTVKVGTPGEFVYQPIKYGWRGDDLYVEVHDDLYGRYAGLWAHAQKLADDLGITDEIDMQKLEKAVEQKTGVPTYIGTGTPSS